MINKIYDGSRDSRTFKDTLSTTLIRLLEKEKDVIYLDADLMRCIGMFDYARKHPDRAIEMGAAEANMIGVAAGLSASGYCPIVHSFGVFASRRCFDQVFLSGGYAGNSLTVIGSDPGICAAFNGGTHMPFEDVALYRTIPGATVVEVTDSVMLESVLPVLIRREGIKYLRVGRKKNAAMYGAASTFTIGKAIEVLPGSDITLIAAGVLVEEAIKAADLLKSEGISAQVIDMFTIKPIDEVTLIQSVKKTKAVVVCENHNRIGGLTDAVSAVLSEHCPAYVGSVSVKERFGEVGPQDYLLKAFHLDAQCIVNEAKRVLQEKVLVNNP